LSCFSAYFLSRDMIAVSSITSVTPLAVSSSGTTTITISGSQFGPSTNAATYVTYASQALSLYGDPLASGYNAALKCNSLVVDSSVSIRCVPPAYSGAAASFSLRYGVCITVNTVSVTNCVSSPVATIGFAYLPPAISAISVSSSVTVGTSGGILSVVMSL
jgi:hypothetical protein